MCVHLLHTQNISNDLSRKSIIAEFPIWALKQYCCVYFVTYVALGMIIKMNIEKSTWNQKWWKFVAYEMTLKWLFTLISHLSYFNHSGLCTWANRTYSMCHTYTRHYYMTVIVSHSHCRICIARVRCCSFLSRVSHLFDKNDNNFNQSRRSALRTKKNEKITH